MRLTAQDHATVTAAVGAAEAATDGEIVTIVARSSDAYHDVGLHYAVLAMLLVLALLAAFPGVLDAIHALFADPWTESITTSAALTIATFLAAVTFLAVRYLLAIRPLRMALTPRATKARRVRARALALFRAAAEQRTRAATGVLLYLSLDEHRAELIADAAIHGRVPDDIWGHAMEALIVAVKDGRPGDGMAAAVAEIGVVLAEHFPRSAGNPNELPDRLIEL
ncbi:TPM domain-containing protein [Sphingomonas radiodurans]|uniref:TPM domain-containing protein n=1 Tax=Sphingomonas radiodurans TaxID=2890321 RepID=UPI001E2D1054|nr:TPM domain-containing protein [Sphingomonas radiodurans]WBH17171.1 TPM domain-containing protein [Sphingomonas radiodurans]